MRPTRLVSKEEQQGIAARALLAYLRDPRRQDGPYDARLTKVAKLIYIGVWQARSGSLLAVYRLRNTGLLRRLRRWPTELEQTRKP